MIRIIAIGTWLVACLATLAGCVGTPAALEDLQRFRASFQDAQRAGDILYDKISPFLDAPVEQENCGSDSIGAPLCFEPKLIDSGIHARNEHSAIKARRLALALATEYANSLVDLSEGRSGEGLAGKIDSLASAATALSAVGGAAIPSLPALLTDGAIKATKQFAIQLDNAKAAQTVRSALIADRKTVTDIIDFLIGDTTVMYKIYYRSLQAERMKNDSSKGEFVRQATDYHGLLSAYVTILQQTKQAYIRLTERASRPAGMSDIRNTAEEANRLKQSAEAFWLAMREANR